MSEEVISNIMDCMEFFTSAFQVMLRLQKASEEAVVSRCSDKDCKIPRKHPSLFLIGKTDVFKLA